ncbi:hypothetical protein Q9966_016807 [Columba livia]|nr:hypothetical protein Q9966_016807 [Columba livia]
MSCPTSSVPYTRSSS